MKKVKEKKDIDFSRVPDHIFDKALNEYVDANKKLEAELDRALKVAEFLNRCEEFERSE